MSDFVEEFVNISMGKIQTMRIRSQENIEMKKEKEKFLTSQSLVYKHRETRSILKGHAKHK